MADLSERRRIMQSHRLGLFQRLQRTVSFREAKAIILQCFVRASLARWHATLARRCAVSWRCCGGRVARGAVQCIHRCECGVFAYWACRYRHRATQIQTCYKAHRSREFMGAVLATIHRRNVAASKIQAQVSVGTRRFSSPADSFEVLPRTSALS